jgi:hypothetical protein
MKDSADDVAAGKTAETACPLLEKSTSYYFPLDSTDPLTKSKSKLILRPTSVGHFVLV